MTRVDTAENTADVFTKPLAREAFDRHVASLGLVVLADWTTYEVAPAPVPPEAWHGLQPGPLPTPSAPVEPSAVQALMDAGSAALDGITSAALDAAASAAMDAAAQPGLGQSLLRGVMGYLRRRGRSAAASVGSAAVVGLLASSATSSSSSSSSAAGALPPGQEDAPHDAYQ